MLELCSLLQSAWPGKEQSLFCRDGNDRMEESECASESAQARESEAHFSAGSSYLLCISCGGEKKMGMEKKTATIKRDTDGRCELSTKNEIECCNKAEKEKKKRSEFE